MSRALRDDTKNGCVADYHCHELSLKLGLHYSLSKAHGFETEEQTFLNCIALLCCARLWKRRAPHCQKDEGSGLENRNRETLGKEVYNSYSAQSHLYCCAAQITDPNLSVPIPLLY